jgi:hypothetical protein
MLRGSLAVAVGLAVTGSASATFTSLVVTSANTTNSGQALTVYTVVARFNGPTDTLLNVFNFGIAGNSTSAALSGFWHKDLNSTASNTLTQAYGTWSPARTGSATLNRPVDSYLTIGNQAVGTNTTNADPSWPTPLGWDRPDLPGNGTIGWFNSNPPNFQGRVGVGANTATDVRIGQFVLSQGDATLRTYVITLGYNDGVAGNPVQFATSQFTLPAPGAAALLGLAGLIGRRRR